MPLPPPKKKLPPRKELRQNGLRFQPNQLFESVDEIEKWLAISYPGKKSKIISSWKVQSVACQVEVEQ